MGDRIFLTHLVVVGVRQRINWMLEKNVDAIC